MITNLQMTVTIAAFSLVCKYTKETKVQMWIECDECVLQLVKWPAVAIINKHGNQANQTNKVGSVLK